MCCSTGLCGPSVNPELLRVSMRIEALRQHGITVQRFNLSGAPEEFVRDAAVREYLQDKGAAALPCTTADGKVVICGRYPTDAEFARLLNVTEEQLISGAGAQQARITSIKPLSKCCGGTGQEESRDRSAHNHGCCCGGCCD